MNSPCSSTALAGKALKLETLLIEAIEFHKRSWERMASCPKDDLKWQENLQDLEARIYLYDKQLKSALQMIQNNTAQGFGSWDVPSDVSKNSKSKCRADSAKPPFLRREGCQESPKLIYQRPTGQSTDPRSCFKSSRLGLEDTDEVTCRDVFMTALALVSVEETKDASEPVKDSNSSLDCSGKEVTRPLDTSLLIEPSITFSLSAPKNIATRYLESDLMYPTMDRNARETHETNFKSSTSVPVSSSKDLLSEKVYIPTLSKVNLLKRKNPSSVSKKTLTLTSPFVHMDASENVAAEGSPQVILPSNISEIQSSVHIKRLEENTDITYVNIKVSANVD